MRKLRTSHGRLRHMLVTALKSATPTLRQIAQQAGVSYSAVRMYVRGHRSPAPAVMRRLALALGEQGKRLMRLAEQLDKAATRR